MNQRLFDLISILEGLCRAKKSIALFVLGLTLFALLLVQIVPKSYEAEAVILPPYRASVGVSGLLSEFSGLFPAMGEGGEFVLPFMITPSDLYAALISTPAITDTVIIQFGLAKEYRAKTMLIAREKFKKHLKVKLSREGLIKVKFSAKTPQKASDIVNALLKRLDNLNQNLRIWSARNYRMYIEERLKECGDSLEKAKNNLVSFQKSRGLPAIEAQTQYALSTVANLQAELLQAQYELSYLRNFMSEKSARIKTLETRVNEIQKTLASLEAQPELSAIPLGQVPDLYITYLTLLREYQTQQTLYIFLTQQFEQARLEEAKNVPVIQVLYWASPQICDLKPKRGIVTIATFLSSLIIALLGISARVVYQRYATLYPERGKRLARIINITLEDLKLKRKANG